MIRIAIKIGISSQYRVRSYLILRTVYKKNLLVLDSATRKLLLTWDTSRPCHVGICGPRHAPYRFSEPLRSMGPCKTRVQG